MKSEWKTEILEHVCQLITDGAHNSPKSVESGEYMASVKDFTDSKNQQNQRCYFTRKIRC